MISNRDTDSRNYVFKFTMVTYLAKHISKRKLTKPGPVRQAARSAWSGGSGTAL